MFPLFLCPILASIDTEGMKVCVMKTGSNIMEWWSSDRCSPNSVTQVGLVTARDLFLFCWGQGVLSLGLELHC